MFTEKWNMQPRKLASYKPSFLEIQNASIQNQENKASHKIQVKMQSEAADKMVACAN